ncbi:MAG: LacI family transcriptional regulator [Candidatus Dormibacteraeota bacterium]|nr:LacI family transcriptional regulator [Candidatus Dormibacteraeota bacterium]
MPPARKRVTLQQIAHQVDLSPSAVSYALRGMHVAKETEERVRRVADELGYTADPIARALASGRTGMIGVLCASLADLWQQRVSASLGRALLERDLFALIVDSAGDPVRELALARQLRDQRVDGLIVSPLDPSAGLWAELENAMPLVAIGDSLTGVRPRGEVLYDNNAGVSLALGHLAALGHRRLGVLTPSQNVRPNRPTEVYVEQAATRLGLQVRFVTSPHWLPEATAAAHEVLGLRPRPTAVFCFSDSIAHGAYAAARDLGLAIPQDVSIVGYDDQPVSGLLSPALTTVGWDIDRLVRAATDFLVAAVRGGRRRRLVLQPRLVQRESTARPLREHREKQAAAG